jgi:MFS family permease
VWLLLTPFKIFDRIGKIRSAHRDAIVADISSEQNRGENFGLMKTMDNLGAVCGVISCIIFFEFLGYRKLFLLAALPSLLSAYLIFFKIKETKPSDRKLFTRLCMKDFDNNFKLFIVVNSFFALGSFSYSLSPHLRKSNRFSKYFHPRALSNHKHNVCHFFAAVWKTFL